MCFDHAYKRNGLKNSIFRLFYGNLQYPVMNTHGTLYHGIVKISTIIFNKENQFFWLVICNMYK